MERGRDIGERRGKRRVKNIDDMKVKYDAEIEKMAKLVEKKKSISRQEIIKLLDTTTRTDDEIKAFLRGENPDEEDE